MEYPIVQHFDDFLATLEAQGPQFETLRRITRVEQRWERLRGQEREREQREQEGGQQSRRETQQIRTLEKKKILQEKRQERERRKTQEISLVGRQSKVGKEGWSGNIWKYQPFQIRNNQKLINI